MPLEATARFKFVFEDRDGRTAYTQWYMRSSTSINAALLAFNNVMAPRIQALSDATLISFTVTYNHFVVNPPDAPATSNVRRNALLFFRNVDEDINALKLLSPRSDIFESDGKLKGIRTGQHIQIDLFTILSSLPFVTVENAPFGTEYVTGGLSL